MAYRFSKENEFIKTPRGEYPKEWSITRVDQIISLEYGRSLPENLRKNGHYPVFGSNGVVGYHNQSIVKGPGIVVGRKGTIGSVTFSSNDFWPIDTAYFVKIKGEQVDFKWLFYELMHQNLPKLGSADVVPGLRRNLVHNLIISIPPLPEQRAIVGVLGVVDSAIELADQVIAKTERLKRGLMQQLLTRGIGDTETKQTPIGTIPENWVLVKLGDIARVERGKFGHRPRNEPRFYGGKYPFIQTGDIASAKGLIKTYTQTLNEEGLEISRMFKKGTIVISIAGNIGDVGILDFDACFPDSVIGITPCGEVDSFFLMYLLQYLQHDISAKAPRSTQKNINLDIIKPIKIPLPPLSEQQKISAIITEVGKKLEIEVDEKAKLENIKRGLMDLLLTGKVRIKVD